MCTYFVSKTLGERHWYIWSALNNLEEKTDIQTQDGIRKNDNLLWVFFFFFNQWISAPLKSAIWKLFNKFPEMCGSM